MVGKACLSWRDQLGQSVHHQSHQLIASSGQVHLAPTQSLFRQISGFLWNEVAVSLFTYIASDGNVQKTTLILSQKAMFTSKSSIVNLIRPGASGIRLIQTFLTNIRCSIRVLWQISGFLWSYWHKYQRLHLRVLWQMSGFLWSCWDKKPAAPC